MEKDLKNYLIGLGFDEEEIKEFCERVPGLEIIDGKRAFTNIALVLSFGFPEADIDSIIAINPGFLCNDPKYLRDNLSKIGDNIEEKLKADPFLI